MKVLLIQPPIEDFYDTGIRTYPLALLSLAARIEGICDVCVLDLRSNTRSAMHDHPFPELKAFYRHDIQSPFALFRSYYRFGMSRKEIRAAIIEADPDLVGISSLFTTYSAEAIDVARIVKDIDGRIITVMGGTHPTLFPDQCLDSPYVDYVIRGEGETALFELIAGLDNGSGHGLSGIEGLCFDDTTRHVAGIAVEKNIDLPPSRGLINAADYRIGRKRYAFMLTSRGCPFQCAFCGKPPVPYRRRGIASIEEEIASYAGLGIEAIDFEDDMLNLDVTFFSAVLDLFRDTGLTLSAMNGLYAGSLNEGILDHMFRSGFRRLNFSLVDVSHGVHLTQQRAFPQHLARLFDYLESTPFLTEAHFIVGLPGQTHDDVIQTMVFLMERRLLPGPSIYYAAPNSPLVNARSDHDGQMDPKLMRSSVMYPSNPDFQRETTFTFIKLQRFINLVKDLLDRHPGVDRLSDLVGSDTVFPKPHDSHMFQELVLKKRFVSWDTAARGYVPDPQNGVLVQSFFKSIRGRKIRGFKTTNSLAIDV